MVNDGTESIDMVFCENCVYCTKMETECWKDEDGALITWWMCECGLDGSWAEKNEDSTCPSYIDDKSRI